MIGSRIGPYEITAKLGEGGMGEVYRARDTRLGRDVALKVMPAALAGDAERIERFRREARAAAALSHPNIVTLHSIEEAEGVTFLTMELVEGEGLDRLVPATGMPIERVVDIGVELAAALAAAHEKGIVHRDLKPANVMVDAGGHVKVLDFGLAKVEGPAPGDGMVRDTTLLGTQAGALLGTLPYMAPEQLRGDRVDARTDLFALGVLLFELATGERPFRGTNGAELSGAILRDPPPGLVARRPQAPADLERIVSRCLEKDPRDRYAAASVVHDELRLLRRGSGAQLAAGGTAAGRPDAAIAVLPFSDMSPGRDQEALCEGMAEEIMTALVGIAGLRVAARASAFRAKREGHDPEAIARLLRVGIVLDGSVRTAGKRLRVTAQLVDAASGFQLWSERYDRDAEDLFAVQDDIASAVVGAVRSRLGAASAAAPRRESFASLEAYQAYLRARHLRYSKNDPRGALQCYEQAVALDPACAPAWVGMAEVHWLFCFYSMVPVPEASARARAALATAVGLFGDTADASYVSGLAAFFERRWSESRRFLLRAIELDPHHTESRCWLGTLSVAQGRYDEGAAHFEWARAIDPLAAYPYGMSGLGALQARRPATAQRFAEQGLAFDPDHPLSLWILGMSLTGQGRVEEAIAPLEHAVTGLHRAAFVHGALGWALAVAGRRDAAGEILDLIVARPAGAPAVVSEAWIRAELGDMDGAWAALEKSEAEGQFMLLLANFPGFDRFWPDPRFRAVVARLGLPVEQPPREVAT